MNAINEPLITIITVCYNAEKCLSQTIESVLNQTWTKVEYIIVDGNSSDSTMNIVKSYEKSFIEKGYSYRYISEKDNGIYDAMNKGIDMAQGTWINMMNAGDGFASSGVLEQVFSHSIPIDVKVIYGDVELVLNFGKVRMCPKSIHFLKRKMAFCHQAAFVDSNEMKMNPFDLSYRLAADYDFFFKYYNHGGHFLYCDLAIAYFESENGVSSQNRLTIAREYARIHGIDSSLTWMSWFIWKCFQVKLKEGLYFLLPKSVLGKIRERNYGRLVNRRLNNG